MQGERFINERGSDASIVEAMRQTDRCFMLMDAASFEEYARSCVDKKYFSQEELDQWLAENGTGVTVFAHGDTLEELAATVSMDAAGLAATVEKYNGLRGRRGRMRTLAARSRPPSAKAPTTWWSSACATAPRWVG